MAPWRPLGDLWRPWEALGRPRQNFERFLELFGVPFGDLKWLIDASNIKLKSNLVFHPDFEPSGAPLGHFWAHVGGT